MPKVSPFLQEVVYLVADFLSSIEHTKEAQKLKKEYELPQVGQESNPLIKKGLTKVLKDYANENQKVLKYFKSRKPDSDEEVQSEEEVQTPKPTKKARKSVSPKQSPLTKPKSPLTKPKSPKISTAVHDSAPLKGWMGSQFQQPKRLQDLNDNDEQQVPKQQPEVVIPKKDKKSKKEVKKQESSEQESESQQTPKPKKKKKQIKKQKKGKKAKGPVDTSYLNSEEEFELEDKKPKRSVTPQKSAQKVEPVKKTVPAKKVIQTEQVEVQKNHVNRYQNNEYQDNNQNGYNGPKKFFSRINENEVGHIPENRKDNTFEAKARYGAGDAWGEFGHQKLKDTRGDSFKKTKGKLKNKAFQGSGINIDQVNSVPIL